MIPKVIHYCWLSGDPVPENLQKCMESWKRIIPDYEFVKWDFSRFDRTGSIWVQEAFENKKYAFAADYIRLYAVYNYGGIYMDMDIEVLKRFDDLLVHPYMFAVENENATGIEAGCFGAEKKDSFVKKCLAYYDEKHFVNKDGKMENRPLPQIMRQIMDENHFGYQLYPAVFFTVKSFDTGEIRPTDHSYAIHHFAGSWLSEEERDVVALSQKLAGRYGSFWGRIMAQYLCRMRVKGLKGCWELTVEKIKHKLETEENK